MSCVVQVRKPFRYLYDEVTNVFLFHVLQKFQYAQLHCFIDRQTDRYPINLSILQGGERKNTLCQDA